MPGPQHRQHAVERGVGGKGQLRRVQRAGAAGRHGGEPESGGIVDHARFEQRLGHLCRACRAAPQPPARPPAAPAADSVFARSASRRAQPPRGPAVPRPEQRCRAVASARGRGSGRLAEEDGGVGAAEAEAVRQRHVDACRSCAVCATRSITALAARVVQVQRRRRHVVAHRENREDRLDRARRRRAGGRSPTWSRTSRALRPRRRTGAPPPPAPGRRRAASRCRGR